MHFVNLFCLYNKKRSNAKKNIQKSYSIPTAAVINLIQSSVNVHNLTEVMEAASNRLTLLEKMIGFRREILRTLNLTLNAEMAAMKDRELSNALHLGLSIVHHTDYSDSR